MNNSDLSETKASTLDELLFNELNFVPAVRSNSAASLKLEMFNHFCGFVDGKFVRNSKNENDESTLDCFAICDDLSIKHLCEVDDSYDSVISFANESSTKGFKIWSSLSAHSRSKILNRIAETIESNQGEFISIEALCSGKHAYKVKTKDIPNLIESFYYYADCSLQPDDEFKSKLWFPTGPVCVTGEEYNNPSLTLSIQVSSLLASGNSVLFLPDVKTSASAMYLAQLCSKAGLPDGVLNIVPVEQDRIKTLGDLHSLSKVLFTGCFEKAKSFSELSGQDHVPCDVLIPKRPVVIVYENVDLHSAANSILESMFYRDTRCESGGCKVLIQESIYEKFLEILEYRFSKIRVGQNLTNTDLSCAVTECQKKILTELIEEAKKCNMKVISLNTEGLNLNYTHLMPVLISDLQTNSKLVHEELGGPIIVTVPFRTVKESVSMFNCDNKGSPVSIWTEKISVAIEVALKLKSGVVWVNSENIIDARIAFSGIDFSGNSVEGGKDAYFSHLSVFPELLRSNKDKKKEYDAWLLASAKKGSKPSTIQVVADDKIEYKLYINGILKRSGNGTTAVNENALIPAGTESDVRSAISSAVAAQPKWVAMTDSQKRKIFFAIISKLKMNEKEYITELQKVSGNSLDKCEKEVADTLDFLYYWASKNEKFNGSMQEVRKNFIVLQNRNPLGIIGIQCPDEKPLLSFVSLIIPAITFGNAVVALTSTKYPTLALKLCEIFILSNVPVGVINVICGDTSCLIRALCQCLDVSAVWYSDIPSKVIFTYRKVTQRVFCCRGIWNDFNEAKSLKYALESTFSKTIFLPGGETFAN